jgi:hypothetical protein
MRYALVLMAALSLACGTGRKGSAGFHLPDGDPEKGKAVFLALRCHTCHRVEGMDFPAPVASPPVPVVLGGEIPQPRTDGELVAAIIDPSHKLAPGYKKESVKGGDLSRMGDFSDALTVRELVDLVAFLQSRYKVVAPPPPMR